MNGHVRIPHDWVAAWRHEPRVIAFLAVYAHDEFFGTTRTVRDYAEVFDLRKSRVGRLMQKWQNHRLEAADDSGNQDWDNSGTERDKTAPQVPDIAQVTEGQRDNSGTERDNSGTVPYLPKAETEEQTRDRSPDAERLTILFADTLASAAVEHGISRRKQARPPKAWFVEMDRLLRLDGIEASVVEEVLIWAITESDFWGTGCGQGVLQSVPKLRKHWDIIASQRAEAQPRGRFDVAKRVLAASEGGKRGHRREGPALRVLAGQLDSVRQRGQ
jgi:hypothetical protein